MNLRSITAVILLTATLSSTSLADEAEALRISANIQAIHSPHNTIIDPIFVAPSSDVVARYTRGGDSAIWTGHYLAAEAFRYRATRSPEALANAKKALKGLKGLVNVTGTGLLARVRMPVDWEASVDENAIIAEEAGHGVYRVTKRDVEWYWVGNTSRDQYVGVFFGLAVAYDLIDQTADPKVQADVAWLVTKMLKNLLKNEWVVRMPNGLISTAFTGRVDQQLMLLQVGAHVNPDEFGQVYRDHRRQYGRFVAVPIAAETQDVHNSYFKFNLAYATLYTLIRLEEPGSKYLTSYNAAYSVLRAATASHGNAHFNAIDRALEGTNVIRDLETRSLLRQWLERPRRDQYVNLMGLFRECEEDRACEPIPVEFRVPTDFLWQRSPFQMSGGADGTIETAGIDYILPYWMSRAHGVPVD